MTAGLRQAGRVWRYNLVVLRKRSWEHLLFLAEPLSFLGLTAMLGPVIGTIAGLPYALFAGPALATAAAMIESGNELVWATHRRLDRTKVYEGIVSTPAEPGDIVLGEVLWAGTRAVVYGSALLIALAVVGAVRSPLALLAPAVFFIVGLHFGTTAIGAAAAAGDSELVNMYRTYFTNPQLFFAGVFFPVDALPPVVRAVVWCMPLHHAVEITRDLTLGRPNAATVGHLAWLLVTLAVVLLAVSCILRRRLVA